MKKRIKSMLRVFLWVAAIIVILISKTSHT